MKFKEDASYLLNSFNKAVPYVDNCAGNFYLQILLKKKNLFINFFLILSNCNIFTSIVKSNTYNGQC